MPLVSKEWWILEFLNLSRCFQHPWKLTSGDFWSSRNKKKPLSKENVFWQNAVGISEMVSARDFNALPLCSGPLKTYFCRDFWSSRNKRTPRSKQKCVLRKCCGVSQNWWMLELSPLSHCVQHPWKLTCRDFCSSKNERKPLSKQKCVLRKCHGVYQKWWMLELSNLSHSVQHAWKLLVGISGVLKMKESYSLSKNMISEIAVGYLRNGEW